MADSLVFFTHPQAEAVDLVQPIKLQTWTKQSRQGTAGDSLRVIDTELQPLSAMLASPFQEGSGCRACIAVQATAESSI
jgi:hypothetical protein